MSLMFFIIVLFLFIHTSFGFPEFPVVVNFTICVITSRFSSYLSISPSFVYIVLLSPFERFRHLPLLVGLSISAGFRFILGGFFQM